MMYEFNTHLLKFILEIKVGDHVKVKEGGKSITSGLDGVVLGESEGEVRL